MATLVGAGFLVAGCAGEGIVSQPLPFAAPTTTRAATTATTSTATSAAAVPAGFTTFTSSADQFSIAVPADWRQVDPSSPGAAQTVEGIIRNNEKLAPMLSGDLGAKGVKFFALDGDGDGDSVNVVVQPALGAVDADLPMLLETIKKEYETFGATLRSNETVRLAGHSALRFNIDVEVTGSDGKPMKVGEVQYFMVANDLAYIITLAGESPHFPTIVSTFSVG